MVLATDPGKLTERALETLLHRLGPDQAAAAEEYVAIRRRLIGFFNRRGVFLADELADETLDRVARRMWEGEAVEQVKPYCFGVGKRVLLEWRRRQVKELAALEQVRSIRATQEAVIDEAQVSCLERCLQDLPPDSRKLIMDYHDEPGDAPLERRKLLAKKLAITYTSLKTRAHRIRAQLEECLRRCLENAGNL